MFNMNHCKIVDELNIFALDWNVLYSTAALVSNKIIFYLQKNPSISCSSH